MLKIFTGDDRVRAGNAIKQQLGENYEVIEGADLAPQDLPSIFRGTTLFADTRRILIRDLSTNKPVFEKLPDYLDTPHDIIIQELKLDKRSATYKSLKGKIEITEFTLPQNPNFCLVFDIYKTAKRDGVKAVQMLERIKQDEEPIMFFGLLVSQALKDFAAHPGGREKHVLKELAKTDLAMKSTPTDPWLLVESLLLQLPDLQK